MALLLGIDTGGTYSDAVLFDEDSSQVLASAKALTSKHDLSLCVSEVTRAVLSQVDPSARSRIGFVSLSTTLATNALVESHGFPVALVMIGQRPEALDRGGLRQALGRDPVVFVEGGITHDGQESAPLNEDKLRSEVRDLARKAAAFAVCGTFAVRNPKQEQRAREIILEETGRPVSCGHDLSSGLDAPRRALTALLNARLVPLIEHLIKAVGAMLVSEGLAAPLMVVKGDGSLISDQTALMKPVETILSGPAASVVGARFLCGEGDVLVSDIGGTTTDIAVLREGQPLLDPRGAMVGGFRTMVEAVAVHTVGLGGDSQARLDDDKGLVVGPRRSVPLSLLAMSNPEIIAEMKLQLERGHPKEYDGLFLLKLRDPPDGAQGMSRYEEVIWEKISQRPYSLAKLSEGPFNERAMRLLLDKGLAILSAFTPSDAAHVLELHDSWNGQAAELGASLWARRERMGKVLAESAREFAAKVYDSVIRQSCEALVRSGLSEEAQRGLKTAELSDSILNQAFTDPQLLKSEERLVSFSVTLDRPVVGIGAPAATYYPEIAKRLNTQHLVPKFAEVCNAVGAVAGGVSQRVTIIVTSPEESRFLVHAPSGVETFGKVDQAMERARDLAGQEAWRRAEEAGATEIRVDCKEEVKQAQITSNKTVFVEANVLATAYGRPRVAQGGARP